MAGRRYPRQERAGDCPRREQREPGGEDADEDVPEGGPNGARRYNGISLSWTSSISTVKPARTAAGRSTRPPLMANQELPATAGGATSIARVGNSGGGRAGTTNSPLRDNRSEHQEGAHAQAEQHM